MLVFFVVVVVLSLSLTPGLDWWLGSEGPRANPAAGSGPELCGSDAGARWGDRGRRKRRAQPRVHRWESVRYSFMTRGNRRASRWVPVGTEGLGCSSSGLHYCSVLKFP